MEKTCESTGSGSERTWDIYVSEDLARGTCTTSLAPWMKVRLPETDTVEWKPVEDKIASSLPLRKLAVDLLACVDKQPDPVWIDLRSLEGEPLPRGFEPAIRVRSADFVNFPKMALVYEAEPGEEVDIRKQVPNQIIVLPRSQAPTLVLEALRKKLPGRRFELLRQGQYESQWPEWEELSERSQQALPADVLRIKAVPDNVPERVTFLRGDDDAKARQVKRRYLQGRFEGECQPLLLGH